MSQYNISQNAGLSEVFDVKNEKGKIVGHYQWATHKNGRQDSLVVVKVIETEDGEQVLYQTYAESAIAKKVTEEASSKQGVNEYLGSVKLGEDYKAKNGSVQKYGIADLLEFQSIGFIVVLIVLVGLWGLIGIVSSIIKALGLGVAPKTPAAAPVAAAVAAKTIHPGMSDGQFVAIIGAAAAHALGGKPVNVVKFKPLNTMDWTWAVQGRVSLHSHKV